MIKSGIFTYCLITVLLEFLAMVLFYSYEPAHAAWDKEREIQKQWIGKSNLTRIEKDAYSYYKGLILDTYILSTHKDYHYSITNVAKDNIVISGIERRRRRISFLFYHGVVRLGILS